MPHPISPPDNRKSCFGYGSCKGDETRPVRRDRRQRVRGQCGADLDELFSKAGAGTLVVVDQVRNIGSLAISRARLAGLEVAYLPGLAAGSWASRPGGASAKCGCTAATRANRSRRAAARRTTPRSARSSRRACSRSTSSSRPTWPCS